MKTFSAKSRIVQVVLLAGVLPWLVSLAAQFFFGEAQYVHERLHESLELTGSCTALAVALLLLLRSRESKESSHIMWVATALVSMGVVDFAHGVTPFGAAWSWLRHGATVVGGLLFALVWLPLPSMVVRRKQLFMLAVLGLSIAVSLGIWWHVNLLPAPWRPSGYTLATKAANLLGGLGFVAAAIFFLRRYHRHPQTDDLIFASLTLLFGTASLLFGYSHIWSADWWVWHVCRLLAYLIVLLAAYDFVSKLYLQTVRYGQELESRTEDLRRASLYERSLLEASLDPLVTISREGKITDANQAAESATGIKRDRLIGSDFSDYFTEPEKARRGYEEVFQTGFVRDYPLAIRHTSGRVIDVLYNATLFRNEAGEVEGVFAAARDITERKQAQERLRKGALYTRSLLEASLDPLVTISRDGKITDVNEAAEKATGVARDRLIGSDFSDYFTEPEKARQGYQQVFAEGFVQDYPLAIRHTSGRITDVLYNATVFRNEAGEVEGVFAAARDITERKRAEQKLHEQAALLDLAHDGIFVRSMDSRVLFWNRGAADLYGWTADEAIGKISHDLLQSDFPEPLATIEAEIQRVGKWEGEIEHTCRDGKRLVVASRWSLLRDEKGNPTSVLEINRDITERKHAEQALQTERQRFRDVLDKLPVYVVLLTPDYHVALDNTMFRERFGESRGRRCYEFLFNRNRPCEICETYNVLKTGSPHDWKWTGPDGRHYEIFDFPFVDNDGSPLILEMGVDVTEREQAEAEVLRLNQELEQRVRQRTAQLEATNKELEAFTYSVSHDLRAPLRHISGFAKILSEEFEASLPPEAQHHLQRIDEGTRRMGMLVDDLLNLARIGRRELNSQISGLRSIVDEVILELKPEYEQRQIEWKIGNLPFVECDAGLMKQVFQNLLSNALKFTRPRAQTVIEIGQQVAEGPPVIFVRDNGVGFSMKYADKLFGVFQRLHRSEDFEGTGVGLATVQRIVQKHGGSIWTEAELDKGATFYFTVAHSVNSEIQTKVVAAGDQP